MRHFAWLRRFDFILVIIGWLFIALDMNEADETQTESRPVGCIGFWFRVSLGMQTFFKTCSKPCCADTYFRMRWPFLSWQPLQ